MGSQDETLKNILVDLHDLASYLDERGQHTYTLAQKFNENAKKDPSSRGYDERQATMLGYQHFIWHEVSSLVQKLVKKYENASVETTSSEKLNE